MAFALIRRVALRPLSRGLASRGGGGIDSVAERVEDAVESNTGRMPKVAEAGIGVQSELKWDRSPSANVDINVDALLRAMRHKQHRAAAAAETAEVAAKAAAEAAAEAAAAARALQEDDMIEALRDGEMVRIPRSRLASMLRFADSKSL